MIDFLQISGAGAFPNVKYPRVVWLGFMIQKK